MASKISSHYILIILQFIPHYRYNCLHNFNIGFETFKMKNKFVKTELVCYIAFVSEKYLNIVREELTEFL